VSRLLRDASQDDDEWEDLEQPTVKETDKPNPTGEWESEWKLRVKSFFPFHIFLTILIRYINSK
jgi:hypothetical protein